LAVLAGKRELQRRTDPRQGLAISGGIDPPVSRALANRTTRIAMLCARRTLPAYAFNSFFNSGSTVGPFKVSVKKTLTLAPCASVRFLHTTEVGTRA